MAAKKANLAQAKAARQKKIAIAGGVLLAVILVVQGPKMLKLLKGSSTPAPAAVPAPAPVPATPVAGVPTASAPPAADKLVSFESFDSKDPFIQQVTPGGDAAPATTTTPAAGGTASAAATKTTTTASSTPTAFKSDAGAGTSTAKGGGTVTIQVNGTGEKVAENKTFPKADPVFRLVSIGNGSVEIAIADGSFKDGDRTITLTEGKSLTLLNTADNKRYSLLLVSAG